MFKRSVLATLLASSVAFAEMTPTSRPSTAPTTGPVSMGTTQPSTRPSALKKFPTPAELARKMLEKTEAVENKIQVAFFNLATEFRERPADFSLFGEETPTLRDLIDRLEQARDDAKIKSVLLYMGSGTGLSLAQAQEVREVLADFRRAGKKTFVYADTYDTAGYVIASAATNVCLLQGGEIFVPGVGFETMFYKGTLDKIGVHADYVQIGEYKGAEEPFTRSQPSEELAGEMNKLVDAYYKQIVDGISLGRNISRDEVKRVIDDAMISARQAKDNGWVDHLVDSDGLRDLMTRELGDEVNVVHHYGEDEREATDMSNPFALLQLLNRRPEISTRPQVAVVYAEGAIIDGRGGQGMLGGMSVGSEDVRRAMRMAMRDENVKAVVIRIDSPGGSALASEAMWQSVRRVAEKKPVIISIGSMAASGGYYLASAGDYIIADPAGIVGSIGVVGGKFVLTDLYEKIGVTTMDFRRGQNAGLFSSNEKFDDRQKRMVRTWMRNTYDQFTDRISQTRGKKIKNIDEIARGRIFLAADAKALGMVDELGGLSTAVRSAADRSKLLAGEYDVTVLPPPSTLADLISGQDGADAGFPIKPQIQLEVNADSFLKLLPSNLRQTMSRQLQLMELLENRPVVLMSPFVITGK